MIKNDNAFCAHLQEIKYQFNSKYHGKIKTNVEFTSNNIFQLTITFFPEKMILNMLELTTSLQYYL